MCIWEPAKKHTRNPHRNLLGNMEAGTQAEAEADAENKLKHFLKGPHKPFDVFRMGLVLFEPLPHEDNNVATHVPDKVPLTISDPIDNAVDVIISGWVAPY